MIHTRYLDVVARDGERSARLAVHMAGQGPLAMLVHGFPLDHRMWLDVLQGELTERRTLCAIDLRCHGESPWCGDAVHTMERFADDIAAVIKSLAPDGQGDVCGLSMGGYVTFALHARHPHLIRSLVLTNTRAANDNDAQRQGRENAIETVVTQGRTAIYEGMIEKLLGPNADTLRQAQIRSMIEGLPVESIVADQRGLAQRPCRLEQLATIKAPTLIVGGDCDTITPVSEAEIMANGIDGARLEVVQGTAHMTPLENAEAWSAAVATHWQ